MSDTPQRPVRAVTEEIAWQISQQLKSELLDAAIDHQREMIARVTDTLLHEPNSEAADLVRAIVQQEFQDYEREFMQGVRRRLFGAMYRLVEQRSAAEA